MVQTGILSPFPGVREPQMGHPEVVCCSFSCQSALTEVVSWRSHGASAPCTVQ